MSVYNFAQIDKPNKGDVYDFNEDDDECSMHSDSTTISHSVESASCSNGGESSEADSGINFVELDFEFVCGHKKDSKVLVTPCDYNQYTKHGTRNIGVRYRCIDRKCRSFLIFDEEKNICKRLKSTPRHKHSQSDSTLEAEYYNLLAMNEMRRQCSNLTKLAGGKRMASIRAIFSKVKST